MDRGNRCRPGARLPCLDVQPADRLEQAADGWSDIDVQLKRRWDLVPALVETVKGYAHHESSTLESVVRSRSQAAQAGSLPERGESERRAFDGRRPALCLAEAYPELKASQNFQELQKSLVEIENNVQYARRITTQWSET